MLKRIAVLAFAATALAAPTVASASPKAPLPAPVATALAAGAAAADGPVCGGAVPVIEWDAQPLLPGYEAWPTDNGDGLYSQTCTSAPVIHIVESYWPGTTYEAATQWPQFCWLIVHEYLHFTSWNEPGGPFGGQESNDPASVEYVGFTGTNEPAQCGPRGRQLWLWRVGHYVANPYAVANGATGSR